MPHRILLVEGDAASARGDVGALLARNDAVTVRHVPWGTFAPAPEQLARDADLVVAVADALSPAMSASSTGLRPSKSWTENPSTPRPFSAAISQLEVLPAAYHMAGWGLT